MIRRLSAAVLLALAALLVPVPAWAGTTTVTIDSTLHPRSLTVAPGTTVTWRNADTDRHRVRTTSAPVELDSNDLERGESWSFTFRTAGTYRYVDHRNEDDADYWGTVTVTAGSTGGSTGGGSTGGGGATGGTTATAPASGSVRIANRAFSPSTLRVRAGGTVTFANDDDRAHTVTASDGSFDSGLLSPGGRWAHRFASAGTFRYVCQVHPEMTGTVTVPTSSGSVPAPRPATRTTPRIATAPGGGAAAPPAPSAGPGSARVNVVNFGFTPARVAVHAGDTVSWVNTGRSPHTVTAADGSFGTSLLAAGATYRTVVRKTGTVAYVCQFHPQMKGMVVVLPRSAALPRTVAAPRAAAPARASAAPESVTASAAPAGPAEDGPRAVRRLAATTWKDSPLALWSLGGGWLLMAFLGLAWWRVREPNGGTPRG
jgi:plastocyanin